MYILDIEKFKKLLINHQNLEDAKQMIAYMKYQFQFFGIKSIERKALFKQCLIKTDNFENVIQNVKDLWEEPQRELQYAAMDLLDLSKKYLNLSHLNVLEYLVTTKSWWDTVDHIASHYLGQIWKKTDKSSQLSFCEAWIESDNLWKQRCTIIYQLKYKQETDFEILKFTIFGTLPNTDFFIRKASGWALREFSKVRPDEVKNFIEENKFQLSNLTIKEGLRCIDNG